MVLVFSPRPVAVYCLVKVAAYLLINTVCIFHDFLFIINLSYAAMKLYSGLVWNRRLFFTQPFVQCVTKFFHAWLRRFARHFDAWFYLLYLHPIFTIEEFLDEKSIYGYLTKRQKLCPLIIILIITSVSCVYAYFIESFCFYHPFFKYSLWYLSYIVASYWC